MKIPLTVPWDLRGIAVGGRTDGHGGVGSLLCGGKRDEYRLVDGYKRYICGIVWNCLVPCCVSWCEFSVWNPKQACVDLLQRRLIWQP